MLIEELFGETRDHMVVIAVISGKGGMWDNFTVFSVFFNHIFVK
jgi:hypothetical protein